MVLRAAGRRRARSRGRDRGRCVVVVLVVGRREQRRVNRRGVWTARVQAAAQPRREPVLLRLGVGRIGVCPVRRPGRRGRGLDWGQLRAGRGVVVRVFHAWQGGKLL